MTSLTSDIEYFDITNDVLKHVQREIVLFISRIIIE